MTMSWPMLRQQGIDMARVVVAKRQDGAAGQPRACPQAGMGKLVDQQQIVAAKQGWNDAGIGQVARAENAGGLGLLQARQPRLKGAEQRMVAGDEAGGAGP